MYKIIVITSGVNDESDHGLLIYRGQNKLYKHYWDTTKWSFSIERWSLDACGL